MKPLQIQLRRDDGDVTLLEGVAGVAVVMQSDTIPCANPNDPVSLMKSLPEMPIISLRADNSAQLSVMLAGMIAVVDDAAGPEAVRIAFALAPLIDCRNPQLRREVPRRG